MTFTSLNKDEFDPVFIGRSPPFIEYTPVTTWNEIGQAVDCRTALVVCVYIYQINNIYRKRKDKYTKKYV